MVLIIYTYILKKIYIYVYLLCILRSEIIILKISIFFIIKFIDLRFLFLLLFSNQIILSLTLLYSYAYLCFNFISSIYSFYN